MGEELACQHEEGNPYDVYAIAVKTDAGILSATYRGRFWQPVYCFCVGVVRLCVRSQTAGDCHWICHKEAWKSSVL